MTRRRLKAALYIYIYIDVKIFRPVVKNVEEGKREGWNLSVFRAEVHVMFMKAKGKSVQPGWYIYLSNIYIYI